MGITAAHNPTIARNVSGGRRLQPTRCAPRIVLDRFLPSSGVGAARDGSDASQSLADRSCRSMDDVFAAIAPPAAPRLGAGVLCCTRKMEWYSSLHGARNDR